jgi:hypothetical protein
MRRLENVLDKLFQKNFEVRSSDINIPAQRQAGFYVWVISFVLFFATLFFFIGTRSVFGKDVNFQEKIIISSFQK